ncbi:YciI family protein [Paenibacillus sp. Y412MC10]|uniref:YciI family protein n=1 Tax=Geobacillus sp. (strain Y412MC10) TaxID=481743 RepID=UPI0011A5C872|nr:YciI family protein [Paenibacillus sp. Y412MC10]
MRSFLVLLRNKQTGILCTDLLEQHVQHLEAMSRLGCLRLCGPFTDGDGAVMVFNGRSAEEVEDWVMQDPFIKERYYGSYDIKEFTEANESNRWLMGEPEA